MSAVGMIWIGRLLFLGLFYVFIFHLYRALIEAAAPPAISDQLKGRPPRARIVLAGQQEPADVWQESPKGKAITLIKETTVSIDDRLAVGRGVGNDVRTTNSHVSSHHFVIRREQDGYVLYNLSSTNGTYVDGVRVDGSIRLRPNCTIAAGPLCFRFEVT